MPDDPEKSTEKHPEQSETPPSPVQPSATRTRSISEIQKAAAKTFSRANTFGAFDRLLDFTRIGDALVGQPDLLESQTNLLNILSGFTSVADSFTRYNSAIDDQIRAIRHLPTFSLAQDFIDQQNRMYKHASGLVDARMASINLLKQFDRLNEALLPTSLLVEGFISPSLSAVRPLGLAAAALNANKLLSDSLVSTAERFHNPTLGLLASDTVAEIASSMEQIELPPSQMNDEVEWAKSLSRAAADFSDILNSSTSNVQTRALLWLLSVIVIPYLFFAYGQLLSGEENEKVHSRLSEIELTQQETNESILSAIEGLSKVVTHQSNEVSQYQYYAVTRLTPLTPSRHYQRQRLATLFPGQEVELLERAGKWVRVEVFDSVLQRTMRGWVLKKYLTRVE